MALWLVRAGKSGEYENKFLSDNRIYLTWDGLSQDLSRLESKQGLFDLLDGIYPDNKKNTIRNWASQIRPFVWEMVDGDWIALPSKKKAVSCSFSWK